jgi:hypothetical protein
MSSMKTMIDLFNSGLNTKFMRYMKYINTLVNPKDMTRYSQRLYPVEKTVLGISST